MGSFQEGTNDGVGRLLNARNQRHPLAAPAIRTFWIESRWLRFFFRQTSGRSSFVELLLLQKWQPPGHPLFLEVRFCSSPSSTHVDQKKHSRFVTFHIDVMFCVKKRSVLNLHHVHQKRAYPGRPLRPVGLVVVRLAQVLRHGGGVHQGRIETAQNAHGRSTGRDART